MRYWNIHIWSTDQFYLDKLADIHDIDYYDADIYITEDTTSADITNQLFDHALTQAVNNLDISDENKEYLHSKIYLNCFDSWFNMSSEDIDDMIEWTDEEKQIIKTFLDL